MILQPLFQWPSSGSEMNCGFEHKCSLKFINTQKNLINKKKKHLFWCLDCIIIKKENILFVKDN